MSTRSIRLIVMVSLSCSLFAGMVVKPADTLTGSGKLAFEPVLIDNVLKESTDIDTSLSPSPDGNTLYFTRTVNKGPYRILKSELANGIWKPPVYAEFGDPSPWNSEGGALVSPDGSRICFWSYRPLPDKPAAQQNSNIWMTRKTPGGWSQPECPGGDVNSDAREYTAGLTTDGTLYFTSNRQGTDNFDIFRSRLAGGKYLAAERLDENVNSPYREQAACIAPDESLIVFISNRPGGKGGYDLYISYRKNGNWTPAKLVGLDVDTGAPWTFPTISPDGKDLLFFEEKTVWK